MKCFALASTLLVCAALATGETAVIKADNDETDRGMVVIDIQSDGTYLDVGTALSDVNNDTWCLITNYDTQVTLIGWKDMFAAIPQITSRDHIISATLKVYQRGPEGDETVEVNRVTTPWLYEIAGGNETVVTGVRRTAGGENQYWLGGEATGFSSLDYTTEDAAQFSYTEAIYNKANYVTVTEIVKDMFEHGNHGFVLRQVGGTPDPWMQGDEKTETGSDGYQTRPALYIEYTIGSPHTLTVNSGSGDGEYYAWTVVAISADPAPSGMGFVAWTGDVAGVADVYASATTITMPSEDAEITATYAQTYHLTVNSGSGDGDHGAGAVVGILADAPPYGHAFDEWIGDVAGIADVNSAGTTITMPSADAVIAATYVAVPGGHYLTVNNGNGDGTYPVGAVIPIVASAPPTGQAFSAWVGDTAGVADVQNASTTFTMPSADAIITASYRDVGAASYTIYQDLDEVTGRIYRLDSIPYLDLIDENGFFQTETIIFHDVETGNEVCSLTREKCTDLANIERRPAWSSNGQYISFIGNKVFWNYLQNQLWIRTWAGYNYIANSDGSKRRKLWAVGPSGLTMYQDKFNNWDMSTPNYLYYPAGDKLIRVALGPGDNDTDNTAQEIYTFPNSNLRTIQEMHDWNYMLVEESGTSPNCYVFDLNVAPSDPYFCYSYPLAGAVHPGSFRFRRSDVIVTGGYESIGGGICLKLDTDAHELIPWTVPPNIHGEVMWHLWYGTPDDRVCFSGSALGQSFGLWVRMPGELPIKMGNVCDGHSTWCGHDPDWAFYSSGTNEGEQPNPDPLLMRRVMAVKADGSQLIIMCSPWDRRRGGSQGYDAISRPNQSPDATKFWFHSSMLNPADDYTGSYIGVFRRPHAPTAVSYAGGQISFTPHTLSYEAKCFRLHHNEGTGWQFAQEVPKGQTSFAVSAPGTYMVTALEWSGLESDLSSQTVTVPGGVTGSPVSGWDTTPPAKPADLNVVQESAGRYRLTWEAPTDEDLRYFNVYSWSVENPSAIQQRLIVSPAKDETEYYDWTAPVGGSAYYGITAVDLQGNESEPAYLGGATHQLTVNSGTGSGPYTEGTVVQVAADPAPTGMIFDAWVGDTAHVADVNAASTTVTMPPADVEVTATYEAILAGDLDGNGMVGQGDLDIVLDSWGDSPPADPRADPSGDGSVGQADLDIVLDDWGQTQ